MSNWRAFRISSYRSCVLRWTLINYSCFWYYPTVCNSRPHSRKLPCALYFWWHERCTHIPDHTGICKRSSPTNSLHYRLCWLCAQYTRSKSKLHIHLNSLCFWDTKFHDGSSSDTTVALRRSIVRYERYR
jgi:hypothetical protein